MGRTLSAIVGGLIGLMLLASSASAAADGTVTLLASLPSPASNAAAATLTDGRVLVLGSTPGSQAVLFNPNTGTWSPAAAMPVPGAPQALVALSGDRALVVAGVAGGWTGSLTGDTPGDAAEIYDATTNTWSSAAPQYEVTTSLAATTLANGNVLVAGATNANSTGLTSAEIYDPASNAWTPAAPMPDPAGPGFLVTEPDGTARFIGRSDTYDVGGFATETYNPATNAWSVGEPLPSTVGLVFGAAALPDGQVALIGDADPVTPMTDMVYDPTTGGVVYGSSVDAFEGAPAVSALAGGKVLIAGGAYGEVVTGPDGTLVGAVVPTATVLAWTPPVADVSAELAPTVRGVLWQGQSLVGLAEPLGATPLTFQWQRCRPACNDVGSSETVDPLAGQTVQSPYYALTDADVGAQMRIQVSADGGTATSPLTSPVEGNSVVQEAPSVYSVVASTTPLTLGATAPFVTVIRSDASFAGSVHYKLSFPTADVDGNVPTVTGTLNFAAAALTALLYVPSVVSGTPVPSGTMAVSLSDPTGGSRGGAVLSGGPPVSFQVLAAATAAPTRSATNPLGLPTATAADPLAGARFYVDRGSIAARVASLWRTSNPSGSAALATIAAQPDTTRFGAWNGVHPGHAVAAFLEQAATLEPGTIPMLSTYRIIDGQCHGSNDTAADAAAYDGWIKSFAMGIGTHPAVLFLEMDSLITTPCLSRTGLAIRLGELRYAVHVLAADPHLLVYLDAGAADALHVARAVSLLQSADVADTAGFFLNATHFDWTRKEIAYGEQISKLTGGAHFVVNTAENGRGPLAPADRATSGNEVLCNPPGRGLGPDPTSHTGYRNVDAFAWIANPGVSGGSCRPGAPGTGRFWPALALSLVTHADPAVR